MKTNVQTGKVMKSNYTSMFKSKPRSGNTTPSRNVSRNISSENNQKSSYVPQVVLNIEDKYSPQSVKSQKAKTISQTNKLHSHLTEGNENYHGIFSENKDQYSISPLRSTKGFGLDRTNSFNQLGNALKQRTLSQEKLHNPISPAFRNSIHTSSNIILHKIISSKASRRDSMLGSLRKINLVENHNFQDQAKTGLNFVKLTLEETMQEKESLKSLIEELKSKIKSEEALKTAAIERTKRLKNEAYKLTMNTEHLEGNTTNTETILKKTRKENEIQKNELENYIKASQELDEKIYDETNLIQYYSNAIQSMKAQAHDIAKARDQAKDALNNSRNALQKQIINYQNIEKQKNTFTQAIESQLRAYANLK